ncbi:hypothetical protein KY290_017991 [Solanum tuberosum]|uniref:Uncharacterized protein n=1 Tax=Solanum tuberosum TaxID=4113 RepID=A0ABQ7VEX4_SOLTU|nr:hypothetical protein KY284_016961 [Solanum tuberosum]KAH0702682.1 hypothetical protein KY285_016960 [Solanum tuberosum]KAH0707322.1 hypothetical protein KY289_012398 [Solanum tuberosum]KAH0761918.1 hypothetical protein KY290_017991 [Solanum tuberosum]
MEQYSPQNSKIHRYNKEGTTTPNSNKKQDNKVLQRGLKQMDNRGIKEGAFTDNKEQHKHDRRHHCIGKGSLEQVSIDTGN